MLTALNRNGSLLGNILFRVRHNRHGNEASMDIAKIRVRQVVFNTYLSLIKEKPLKFVSTCINNRLPLSDVIHLIIMIIMITNKLFWVSLIQYYSHSRA